MPPPTPTEALLAYAANPAADLSPFDEARAPTLDLSKRALAGASLRRTDLTRANLAAADLSAVKGPGLILHHANLEATNFTDADLIGANLVSAHAGEANFSNALLEDADLHHAHLRFANFDNAIMDGANLSHADLWGAKFANVAAERAILTKARLDESSLLAADFTAADFTGATLRKARLANARLHNANFTDAILEGADLTNADLSGATLPNLNLTTCTLTHACFAGAWLERTRMRADQLGGQVGEEASGNLAAALESYIVLHRNFLSLGSTEDASWAYRRKRRVGRRLHAQQARACFKQRSWRASALAAVQWLADAAAEWLCDYGESVARVVRAFFTILFAFAALYWLTGALVPRELHASRHLYLLINYLLFSLDSMTTVGTSEVALRPAGELGMLLSSLQTVLGTILLGLFGFVLGAKIRN